MKTSNKLLIAFASTLILLPILVLAVISRVYYAPGQAAGNSGYQGSQGFDVKTENMTATGISTPFERVGIDGGQQQLQLVVKLISYEKFGVKIPNDFKNKITVKVDESGQLRITVKDIKEQQGSYANVWIYAPNISELVLRNASGINLSTASDSLHFVVANTGSAWIEGNSNIRNLLIDADHVGGLGINLDGGDVKSAVIELKSTNFSSKSSFDKLAVNAFGESNVELIGDQDTENRKAIKNLVIHTSGKSEVKLSNIFVAQCSGRFSDSTKVEMPARNINQMYNLKK